MAAKQYPQEDYSRPAGSIEVILVRHGASQAAVEDQPFELLEGQADPALSPAGERQAQLVADHLRHEPLSALYVTPLRRTAQTAAPLAAATGLEPVVVPELREVHLGELDGGAFRIAVRRRDPIVTEVFRRQRWDVIPGAESHDALGARVRDSILSIAARHPDACVAAFTHGGVIANIIAAATSARPFAFLGADNGSISHIVVTPERWIVRRFNDTAHLTPNALLIGSVAPHA